MWGNPKESVNLDNLENGSNNHEATETETPAKGSPREIILDDPNLRLLKANLIQRFEKEFSDKIGNNPFSQKRKKLIFAKLITSLVGLQAGIPYFEVARAFTNDDFGVFLGISISIANAALTTWSLFDVVDNLNDDLSTEEEEKKTSCKKTIRIMQWIVAFILGIASALPSTYIAYKYNNENIYWGAILFISDSIIGVCSMGRVLTQSSLKCKRPIDRIKTLYLDNLENGVYLFVSLENTERVVLFRKCEINLENNFTFSGKLHLLLYEIGTLPRANLKNKYLQLPPCLIIIAKTLGFIFPIFWMVVAFKSTYEGSKRILDDPYFNSFIATLAVGPPALLEMSLSSQVYANFFKFFSAIRGNVPLKPKSSIVYPSMSVGLNALMIGIALFSFGARATVTLDNFSGATGIAFTVMVVITTITYKSFSMPELINKFLTFFTSRNSNSINVNLLKTANSLTHLISTLRKANDQEFLNFLEEADTNKVAQMLDIDKTEIDLCKKDNVLTSQQTPYSSTFFKRITAEKNDSTYQLPDSDASSNPPPRKSKCPRLCVIL